MSLTDIETKKNGRKLILKFVNSPGSYSHDDLPVPIRISNYKQKNRKAVLIRQTVSRIPQYEHKPKRKILLLKKKRKESYDDSEKLCGLSKWCAKKRALKELQTEHKKQEKQAKEWQNWKYKEAERIRQAEIEKERLRREAEYVQQLAEIEQQKREMLRKKSITRYPFSTNRKPPPKDSFSKDLPKDPYYPKKVNLESSHNYLVEKSQKQLKREKKQKEKERKKLQKLYLKKLRDPKPELPQHSKCSRIRTCLNNFCGSTKKKNVKPYTDRTVYNKPETSKKPKKKVQKTPYTDPYENYYDKPIKLIPFTDAYEKKFDKSKKETPYTDPYENYYDKSKKETSDTDLYAGYYDKPKARTSKRKESISDGELYDQYNKLYSNKLASKKRKKRKYYSEPIIEKRKQRGKFSRMFVNCFYRTCCECYCWFSFFLIIGVAIIMVI